MIQASNIYVTQQHILLVHNKWDMSSLEELRVIVKLLSQKGSIYFYTPYKIQGCNEVVKIDLKNQAIWKKITCVFCVGEAETLLNTFRFFQFCNSPPIVGFAKGCSAILYNFTSHQTSQITELVSRQLDNGTLPIQKLMKLSIKKDCVHLKQATCQIQIHRGMDRAVVVLNIYLKDNCSKDKIKIGQFRGDGLLISTPLGSYRKSMNLNGPLMERTMQNIMITPVCPLSMKFRSICLPSDSKIYIQLDQSSRCQLAEIYVDQYQQSLTLMKGEQLTIYMSEFKTNMVSNLTHTKEELFIKGLKHILRWGESFQSADFKQIRPEDK